MNKEDHPSFIGVFKVPCYKGEAGNKAIEIFTKLKRRAEQVETKSQPSSVIPLKNIEPNFQDLQVSAMNSYRIDPEVIKTDCGVEVG